MESYSQEDLKKSLTLKDYLKKKAGKLEKQDYSEKQQAERIWAFLAGSRDTVTVSE